MLFSTGKYVSLECAPYYKAKLEVEVSLAKKPTIIGQPMLLMVSNTLRQNVRYARVSKMNVCLKPQYRENRKLNKAKSCLNLFKINYDLIIVKHCVSRKECFKIESFWSNFSLILLLIK